MKLRDLPAFLLAAASLIGAVSGFLKQSAEAAATYQNVALTAGSTAEDVEELRARLVKVEAMCGAKP